jgi:hypothetical protein
MSFPKEGYTRVKDRLKQGELPIPCMDRVPLKDGTVLENIIPYVIVERVDKEGAGQPRTLQLFYLDEARKAHKINVNDIEGWSVVDGKGIYQGYLLVEFRYFYPTVQGSFAEMITRKVLPKEIYFGIHPNHQKFKELNDFYLNGDDTQYSQRTRPERDRNFPFWRIGAYGDSLEMMQHYQWP